MGGQFGLQLNEDTLLIDIHYHYGVHRTADGVRISEKGTTILREWTIHAKSQPLRIRTCQQRHFSAVRQPALEECTSTKSASD